MEVPPFVCSDSLIQVLTTPRRVFQCAERARKEEEASALSFSDLAVIHTPFSGGYVLGALALDPGEAVAELHLVRFDQKVVSLLTTHLTAHPAVRPAWKHALETGQVGPMCFAGLPSALPLSSLLSLSPEERDLLIRICSA